MCGVAGYVIKMNVAADIDENSLVSMTNALRHRGPDDEGYFWSPEIGLGSRRLSIIDLSETGRMPIWNEDKTVAVIQNGEIYNFQHLRDHLLGKRHILVGTSDTEVIVHLYEELGEKCFEKLDGMYAIAIWDCRNNKLILARDRFGEKPLYYYVYSGGIAFASELKALTLFPEFRREIDFGSIDQFLTLGYIPAPQTPYQNVYKLLPGCYLTFSRESGDVRVQKYWHLPDISVSSPLQSEKEYIQTFKGLFFESVKSRLVSDVPVGAFLSGGIDSSLIVAAMAAVQAESVQTYSIGFRFSEKNNENPIASQVAGYLGVQHHSLWVDFQDVVEMLGKLPLLLDEPLGDPALLASYLITKKVRESGLTVMLSGDGGDELFFGYPVYGWIRTLQTLYRFPAIFRKGLAKVGYSASSVLKKSWIMKGAKTLEFEDFVDASYYLAGYGVWSLDELPGLRGTRLRLQDTRFFEIFNAYSHNAVLQEAHVLQSLYLSDNNQARMDRASMANSIETRAPFLNPKLAEFAASLPIEMKIRGQTFKYLLRKTLIDYVPRKIVNRPKHGFDALPMSTWLRSDLRFLVEEYLNPGRLKKQGLFEPLIVEQTVREHMQGGKFNHWWKIWLLIVLQIWLENWAGL
jgi:asparagine synthase (glutamine-hydrolysing)